MNEKFKKNYKMNKDFKISVPIISYEELEILDNNYNDIIDKVINNSIKLKETLIEKRLLKNLREENEKLKQQNEFLMKQDNILQTLMQWLRSWLENEEYCYLSSNPKDRCRKDIFKEVIDKIKQLKEEMK